MDSENTLKTIEKLMTENSRLQLELQQAIKGRMPDSYLPPDLGVYCMELLSQAGIGKTFREINGREPSLYDMIHEACDSIYSLTAVIDDKDYQLKTLLNREELVNKALNGADLDENEKRSKVVKQASRIRAILELIKIRLSRFAKTNDDLTRLYEEVKDFLGVEE